jgi:hypothetical protein
MKKGFYSLMATTMLVSGLALATPASAQWNNMDHSGSSYGAAPMEEHHEMHKEHHGKKHHEHHGHKHHHHKHHHDDAAKKDDAAKGK